MKANTRRSFKGEGSRTGKNNQNYDPLRRATDRVIREREASGDPYPTKGSFEDQQRYRLESQAIAREKGYFLPSMPRRELTSIESESRKTIRRPSYEQGGRFPSNNLGERMYAQEASEIRSDDKGTFVWYAGDADGLSLGSSDQEWKDAGAVKVYGDFSKYVFPKGLGLDDMIKDDHDYIIRPTEDGSYELDEEQTQAQAGMEDGFNMAEEVQYDDRGTAKDLLERLNRVNPRSGEREMAGEARGGMGASATEDLLERLGQYKRNAYGNKYEQGGMVAKKKGSTIKIAGQYAVDSIKTTPEGNQYVSMELPDGKVVPVFGDWETYGNPDRERRIEDLDYIIYPLGDGTYALDAAEAEAEMLRDEARGVAEQAGPNVEDLLQELNQRSSTRGMRPVRRQ